MSRLNQYLEAIKENGSIVEKIKMRDNEIGSLPADWFGSSSAAGGGKEIHGKRTINKNGWKIIGKREDDYFALLSPDWTAKKDDLTIKATQPEDTIIITASDRQAYSTFLQDFKVKKIKDLISEYDVGDI